MNRIQEFIAQLTGVDDVLDVFESERVEMADVLENLVSDNALLQRQLEDLDYLNLFDIGAIEEILPGRERSKTIARLRRLRADNPLAKQAVKLVVRFTLGKGVQWVIASPGPDESDVIEPPPVEAPPEQQSMRGIVPIKYVDPTKTPAVPASPPVAKLIPFRGAKEEIIQGEADPLRDIINAFWNDKDNQLILTTHKSMQQMLDEIVTDGEKFYACFEDKTPPYVRATEIPIEEITDIIYDPNNRMKPVYYKRQYTKKIYDDQAQGYRPDGNPIVTYYRDYRIPDEDMAEVTKNIKIPASKIDKDAKVMHVMINEIWTKRGKRGVSELYASREWFRVFREFMEGRAAINNAAQAISYVRKIKGGPAAVAQVSGKFGGVPVGDVNDVTTSSGFIRQLTKPVPGAVYDTNPSVELDWLKTDTGAANAKEDARMLLATAGAGVSTMVHYFGEGGDANLATAQSMELPMVKSYEDWQQFIENFYLDFFEYVISVATDPENAAENRQRIGFTFPPIITQDVVKYTTSWSQIVRDIAPNNMAVRRTAMQSVLTVMGVANIDGLMPEIEAEMERAEAIRLQQQQALLQNLQNPTAPPGTPVPNPNQPPPHPLPNQGQDPNMKHLVAGKGIKVSNGPKPA